MLRAGTLNRRITIQRRDDVRDDAGQPIPTWVDLTTTPIWANIAAKSGLATLASDTDVSIASYSIRIRYRPDVAASMRVLEVASDMTPLNYVIYDIRSPLHDRAGRRYTDLVCETGANDG
jgi:SPP1 family predicted phage head-tail adaptor